MPVNIVPPGKGTHHSQAKKHRVTHCPSNKPHSGISDKKPPSLSIGLLLPTNPSPQRSLPGPPPTSTLFIRELKAELLMCRQG